MNAIHNSQPDYKPLAIRAVGDGHSRALACPDHSKEIPTCGH